MYYRIVQHLILFWMEKHYYFHRCIITITLSNESSQLPLSSMLSL